MKHLNELGLIYLKGWRYVISCDELTTRRKGSKRNTRYNAYKHSQKGCYASEVHIHSKIMNCVLMRASRALTNEVPGNLSAMFTTAHSMKQKLRSLQANNKTGTKRIGITYLSIRFLKFQVLPRKKGR